jgi:glyoxylase-like metal-dependent hydrolase (beta-lactamase superfamily II)
MTEFAPFETIDVGDIRVSFLPDGGAIADPLVLFPSSTEIDWTIHGDYLSADGYLRASIGGLLIEAGDHRIAVDTGIGPDRKDVPGLGRCQGGAYLDSLARTGIAPEAVTDVVFTHLHVDHVGWTTRLVNDSRQLTFPNARHLVAEAEWHYWLGRGDSVGPSDEAVTRPLADRVTFVSDGHEIAPGVVVVAAPGHTPGHLALRIVSGEHRALLVGDIVYGAVHVERAEWPMALDVDPSRAVDTRHHLFRELKQEDTIGAAGHFTDSAFGRLIGTGLSLLWRPLGGRP